MIVFSCTPNGCQVSPICLLLSLVPDPSLFALDSVKPSRLQSFFRLVPNLPNMGVIQLARRICGNEGRDLISFRCSWHSPIDTQPR